MFLPCKATIKRQNQQSYKKKKKKKELPHTEALKGKPKAYDTVITSDKKVHLGSFVAQLTGLQKF